MFANTDFTSIIKDIVAAQICPSFNSSLESSAKRLPYGIVTLNCERCHGVKLLHRFMPSTIRNPYDSRSYNICKNCLVVIHRNIEIVHPQTPQRRVIIDLTSDDTSTMYDDEEDKHDPDYVPTPSCRTSPVFPTGMKLRRRTPTNVF